eukprot:TRINITY_DN1402_c1_g1_i1.p1 TRINITY_DN1402_c1_g1~~TRINITY_DN1402_c1_g1_i1.p1  ORF type:complete len:249 (+),score=24.73 TRINITY_DN1402_c1_g1_i1:111-749(+)
MVWTVNSATTNPRVAGKNVVPLRRVMARCTPSASASVSAEEEANPSAHETVSGEWPATFSLDCYESVKEHIKGRICEDSANQFASAVMRSDYDSYVCQASDSFSKVTELRSQSPDVSEVYVINKQRQLVGVVPVDTEADATDVVADYMEPARMFPVHKRLYHAAGVMLKHNLKTLPVVNEHCKLVGVLLHDQVEEALILQSPTAPNRAHNRF